MLDQPKQLLVEGLEEVRFFEALVSFLGLNGIKVQPYGGKSKLGQYLRTFVVTPGFEQVISLGIVRDADSHPAGALQSIQSALTTAKLLVPNTVLVAAGDNPKIVVWVIPRLNENGALEDICLEALVADPAMPCIEDFMQCVHLSGCAPPDNPSKARMHAFLATRGKPDLRLGEAAQAGYLPWDSGAFLELRELLTTL